MYKSYSRLTNRNICQPHNFPSQIATEKFANQINKSSNMSHEKVPKYIHKKMRKK